MRSPFSLSSSSQVSPAAMTRLVPSGDVRTIVQELPSGDVNTSSTEPFDAIPPATGASS